MTDESYAEPLSPVDIERKFRWLVNEFAKANQELRAARDVEVEAIKAHKRGRLFAGNDAPRVERGGFTVSQREEFIDRATLEEWENLLDATKARENCQDYIRKLRDQLSALQSLGASVRLAYESAGV